MYCKLLPNGWDLEDVIVMTNVSHDTFDKHFKFVAQLGESSSIDTIYKSLWVMISKNYPHMKQAWIISQQVEMDYKFKDPPLR